MNPTRLLVIYLFLCAAATSAWSEEASNESTKPNILFIVSDDHGWGDLPSNWDKTEVRLPALTQRFKTFDSNGDGTLQMDELKKQSR